MAIPKVIKLSKDVPLILQTVKPGRNNFDKKDKSKVGVTSVVLYHVGGASFDGKNTGLAHAVEHDLFRRETRETTKHFHENMNKYVLKENAFTSQHAIYLTFQTSNENLVPALKLFMESITRKNISEEEISEERDGAIFQEQKIAQNQPDFGPSSGIEQIIDAIEINPEKQFTNSDILGTRTSLKKLSAKDYVEFKRKYFNAQNLIISVVTSLPEKEIIELFEKHVVRRYPYAEKEEYLGKIPNILSVKNENVLLARPDNYSGNIKVDMALRERGVPSENIHLEAAYDSIEEEIMNAIGKRLWNAVRVDNKLCYDYSLQNIDLASVKFKNFSFSTTESHLRKAIREICGVVKDIVDNGVSRMEFEHAKNSVVASMKVASGITYASPLENIENLLEGYQFVDAKRVFEYVSAMNYKDFNKHIQEIYKAGNMSLVAQGDFDSRKLYNLIEIEEMLGNKTHSDLKKQLRTPRQEMTSISVGTEPPKENQQAPEGVYEDDYYDDEECFVKK